MDDHPKVVALRPSQGDHKQLEAEPLSVADELRQLAWDIEHGIHGQMSRIQIAIAQVNGASPALMAKRPVD